jgi:hypothetical protein
MAAFLFFSKHWKSKGAYSFLWPMIEIEPAAAFQILENVVES